MLMKTAVEWNKDLDEKLEKLYKLRREDIWKGIANDMGIPWRAGGGPSLGFGKEEAC